MQWKEKNGILLQIRLNLKDAQYTTSYVKYVYILQ